MESSSGESQFSDVFTIVVNDNSKSENDRDLEFKDIKSVRFDPNPIITPPIHQPPPPVRYMTLFDEQFEKFKMKYRDNTWVQANGENIKKQYQTNGKGFKEGTVIMDEYSPSNILDPVKTFTGFYVNNILEGYALSINHKTKVHQYEHYSKGIQDGHIERYRDSGVIDILNLDFSHDYLHPLYSNNFERYIAQLRENEQDKGANRWVTSIIGTDNLRIKSTSEYQINNKGEKDGIMRLVDYDTRTWKQTINYTCFFNDGKVDGVQIYFLNNLPSSCVHSINGVRVGRTEFYRRGEIATINVYKNGKKVATSKPPPDIFISKLGSRENPDKDIKESPLHTDITTVESVLLGLLDI